MERLNPNQVEQAIAKMPKVDQAVAKLVQDHNKLEKQLQAANAKLESIKNALPNFNTMQFWGSGPAIFVNKIRAIIDAP